MLGYSSSELFLLFDIIGCQYCAFKPLYIAGDRTVQIGGRSEKSISCHQIVKFMTLFPSIFCPAVSITKLAKVNIFSIIETFRDPNPKMVSGFLTKGSS